MPVQTAAGGPPDVIEQGNAYVFTENFTDFPVSAWTMAFIVQIAGSAAKTVAASTSGSNFLVTLTAAVTANWSPGQYSFAEYVTETASGQRATAKTGIMQVIPDLSQTQAASSAAQMLTSINSAITALTTGGFQSVSVNNVSYTRYDVATLISMRTRLQAEVIREQETANAFRGIDSNNLIQTRFNAG